MIATESATMADETSSPTVWQSAIDVERLSSHPNSWILEDAHLWFWGLKYDLLRLECWWISNLKERVSTTFKDNMQCTGRVARRLTFNFRWVKYHGLVCGVIHIMRESDLFIFDSAHIILSVVVCAELIKLLQIEMFITTE